MNVAFITSEVVPFSKTGGLADVAGSLPAALERLGVEVKVVSPLYPSVRRHALEQVPNLVTVPLGGRTAWGAVRRSGRHYFLEHEFFFSRADRHRSVRRLVRINTNHDSHQYLRGLIE